MTAIKDLNYPSKEKDELTFEESCTSDGEELFKQENKEDVSSELNEDVNHAYESLIEHYFQVSTSLIQSFHLFFIKSLSLHRLILHISIHSRFHISRLNVNFCLLLLHRWLHWKFHFI